MLALRRAATRALSISTSSLPRATPLTPLHIGQTRSLILASYRQTLLSSQWQRRYASGTSDPAETRAEPVADGAVEHQASTSAAAGEAAAPIEGAAAEPVSADDVPEWREAEPPATSASPATEEVQSAITVEPNAVFVGNLFFDVNPDRLREGFERFGNIESTKIQYDNRGLSKGFGWVRFDNPESAQRAIKEMHDTVFEGRMVAVSPATRKGRRPRETPAPRNEPSRTLFIGNMSYDMTDTDLNNLFRPIRNVIDVRVAIDRRTGQPRGFAHADFIDVASAQAAAEQLRQQELYGRRLRVDFSTSYGPDKPRS